MCLATVDFAVLSLENARQESGIGYKLLIKDEDGIGGTDFLEEVKENEWMTSEKPQCRTEESDDRYLAGFHLFTTPEDAYSYYADSDYVVGKFEYKTVLATGRQCVVGGYADCIVADEIKFLGLEDFNKE